MELEILRHMDSVRQTSWLELLRSSGLTPDAQIDQTVLLWDGPILAAAGSRKGNLLKCIAVSQSYQGDGLTATILTALRREALQDGYTHLFLYTKPENQLLFSSLFFYPVAGTKQVLLMESKRNGLQQFLSSLSSPSVHGNRIGALVMNCDPFTLGHRYLIETAAGECDHVYIFVLSEDRGYFSAEDRLQMVTLGTSDLKNVTVFPSGPYLISSATFPTYFLKDRDSADQIHCHLDIEIFVKHFVPHFHITHRYVGSEPFSALTAGYNKMLAEILPAQGLEMIELPRLCNDGLPISASTVRKLLQQSNIEEIRRFVPLSTLSYIITAGGSQYG